MNEMEHECPEGRPKRSLSGVNAILAASGIVSAGLVVLAIVYANAAGRSPRADANGAAASADLQNRAPYALQEEVIPSNGIIIPAAWGSLGKRLVGAGVIDEAKFKALYAGRGGLSAGIAQMLDGARNGDIDMTPQDAGAILNMLWALGLGEKSQILAAGPMADTASVQSGQFASTAGWTLARGNAMDHYAKHDFLNLTSGEERLVETVAKNIYRPCCDNSVYFPDCNHGMAMLGLLEIMASQGATADEMYRAALAANSYWFPDAYLTIARYLENEGIAWNAAKPDDILGAAYSSARGYREILSKTQPVQIEQSGGGSCGA